MSFLSLSPTLFIRHVGIRGLHHLERLDQGPNLGLGRGLDQCLLQDTVPALVPGQGPEVIAGVLKLKKLFELGPFC